MKLRLSITGKMAWGFGMLTVASILNALVIYNALNKSKKLNDNIISIYEPSVSGLEKMYSLVSDSKMLLKNWVFLEKEGITTDKLKLMELMELQIPYVEENILQKYHQWPENDQKTFNQIIKTINDSLLTLHRHITLFLNKPEAYNNKEEVSSFQAMLSHDGIVTLLTDNILSKLEYLLKIYQDNVKKARSEMNDSFDFVKNLIILTSVILIILAFSVSFITIKSLVGPINYIKKILISMGKGVLPKEKIKEGNDEIGEIASALNSLVKGLKEISNFSIEIGKGNFNSTFTPLSDKDILGNSLIKMREELRNAVIEEEKRKNEDAQRNWTTQGIAKFSEILRQNNNNLNELSYNIISNLVNYLEANQGGLFIVNDSDKDKIAIELTACYAYNRQKFLQKIILPGEGLVGRCYQERNTNYLTDIPKDYIKITSGMGDDNPSSLLIAPLLYNDQVFGVIEIASFKKIEPYQIEFVEKIASSIASTISSVKINIQTNSLLEQSRRQAEEMASQEEEMRQNMEELRATQEESARKESELLKEVKTLKKKIKEK
jgi:methyl-accepting chemotaxis protein